MVEEGQTRSRRPRSLDATDFRILRLLQEHGPMTDAELSSALEKELQPAACGKRIAFLKKNKYVISVYYKLNHELLGAAYLCFMYVKIPNKAAEESFKSIAMDDERVLELHSMFGESDYIMKVRVGDKREAINMSRDYSTRGFPTTTVEAPETFKETSNIRLPSLPNPNRNGAH